MFEIERNKSDYPFESEIKINPFVFEVEERLPEIPVPEKVSLHNSPFLDLAYKLAFLAHEGVYRQSGEAYLEHPEAVFDLLASCKIPLLLSGETGRAFPDVINQDASSIMVKTTDIVTLAAAWMHDVLEDNKLYSESVLRDIFIRSGVTEVEPSLIDDLLKTLKTLCKPEVKGVEDKKKRKEIAHQNYTHQINAYVPDDLRAGIVKIADTIHNVATLNIPVPKGLSEEEKLGKKKILQEKKRRKIEEYRSLQLSLADLTSWANKLILEDYLLFDEDPVLYYYWRELIESDTRVEQREQREREIKDITEVFLGRIGTADDWRLIPVRQSVGRTVRKMYDRNNDVSKKIAAGELEANLEVNYARERLTAVEDVMDYQLIVSDGETAQKLAVLWANHNDEKWGQTGKVELIDQFNFPGKNKRRLWEVRQSYGAGEVTTLTIMTEADAAANHNYFSEQIARNVQHVDLANVFRKFFDHEELRVLAAGETIASYIKNYYEGIESYLGEALVKKTINDGGEEEVDFKSVPLDYVLEHGDVVDLRLKPDIRYADELYPEFRLNVMAVLFGYRSLSDLDERIMTELLAKKNQEARIMTQYHLDESLLSDPNTCPALNAVKVKEPWLRKLF